MLRDLSTILLVTILSSAGFAAVNPQSGVVTDRRHNLEWVADAGHVVDSGFSRGILLSRNEARRYIAALNSGRIENYGRTDWRLATFAELDELYYREAANPAGFENFSLFRTWYEKVRSGQLYSWRPRGSRSGDAVFPWPVRTAVTAPPGFKELAVFADNSIQIKTAASVMGKIVANEISSGPTLSPGFEVELDRGAAVDGDVTGDSVILNRDSVVSGTVFCNELSDKRQSPTSCVSVSLPAFPELPPFQTATLRPEAEDVVVGPSSTMTLPAGDYADITIDNGGKVIFSGGIYDIGSILPVSTVGGQCPYPCRSLEFQGPTELRISGRLDMAKASSINGAGLGALASQVILYVGGTNMVPDDPNSLPPAATVGQGSSVEANIWAGNGTLLIDKNSTVEGALLGRDVRVDKDSTVTRATFFDPPPMADPQEVATNGTVPLQICLTGSDPDNDPLDFTIVTPPTHGGLTDPSPTMDCSTEVTYTAATADNFQDSFVFRVTDPNGGFDEATVIINPDSPDPDDTSEPPPAPTDRVVARGQSPEAAQDMSLDIVLRGYPDVADPDSVGDFSFSIESGPSHGGLTTPVPIVPAVFAKVRSASTIYTPDMGFTGSDSFNFEVCGDLTGDGDTDDPDECDIGTITISVLAVAPPIPPVAEDFVVRGTFSPDPSQLEINLTDGSAGGSEVPRPESVSAQPGFDILPSRQFALGETPNNPGSRGYSPESTAVMVDGGWVFHNDCDLGSPCPSSPFTFTATGTGACVSVTDALVKGDQYIVSDGSTQLGTTPLTVQDDGTTQSDPDAAFADPDFSSGTYYVGPGSHSINVELTGVYADPLAASYIRVDSVGSGSYCPGLPNLEVTAFSAPTQANLGEAIGDQIMVTLTNSGSGDIFPGTAASIGFYTSTDTTITTSDCLLVGGRESVAGGIPAGQSISDFLFSGATIDTPCPSGGTPPEGSAFIGVLADEFDNLVETNEADNTASQAILIGPPRPDLVISSFTHTPASPDSETQIEITATVENVGIAAAAASKLCLDVGGEICPGGAPLFDIPSLGIDENFTVVRVETLPAGSYINNAVADALDDVDESDENNNSAQDTVVVTQAMEGTGTLLATIKSLPSVGSLFDSTGVQIASVPTTLPDTRVTYVPPLGVAVSTSFMYELVSTSTGLVSNIATINIELVAGSCLTNAALCDDGRP